MHTSKRQSVSPFNLLRPYFSFHKAPDNQSQLLWYYNPKFDVHTCKFQALRGFKGAKSHVI